MSRERHLAETPRPAPSPVRAATPSPSIDPAENSAAHALRTVYQSRGVVAAVAAVVLLLGVLYWLVATPIYRGDVVLQVEEATKSIAGLGELSALFTDKIPADTEMELIKSRSLLGSVVEDLALDIRAAPVRFPVIGGAVARRWHRETPAPALLGFDSYGWGGERIHVQRLDVPEALLGKRLILVAGSGDAYELRGPDHRVILSGHVGKVAAAGEGPDHTEIFVSDLVARPGTRFVVMRHTRSDVVASLQERLTVAEKGKKTGILVVRLEDADRGRAAAVLDTLAKTYVRQNVEHKSAEAAKTLAFLETQLPMLRSNLEAAEAARKAYQVRKGTLDLSREAASMLERSVAIEKALSEAELERAQLRQRFTESHPALLAAARKLESLRQERDALNARMRELPGTEVDSARLTRDVRVANELYNVLLNKAEELRVVKSGTLGNVRIVDPASVPEIPVKPNPSLVFLFSIVLGVTGGMAVAFMRSSLNTRVDDPDAVEHATGVSVYATIPRSPKQATLARHGKRGPQPILAAVEPADPAVESLRSLRTAIGFALLEAKNNVVVVTGPTDGVGKSFVTVNLAYVMAASGRRILVVDGDLRRGGLHRFFDGERHPGLSDVLGGGASLAEAVRASNLPDLQWLPTGAIPPNPAELLASERFERVLGELSARYDLVIVDTAPILPVTDAAVIGRSAASTILVLAAGMHPMREIVASIKRLAHNGVRVQGAVMNDLAGKGARYDRNRYEYRYESRP